MDLDELVLLSLDSPTRLRVIDEVNGQPRWLGFNCVDPEGCYLTAHQVQGCEQILLTREQIEWLADEGLPALLSEMGAR